MLIEPASIARGKTLLITGGTGSFGNTLLRNVLDHGWDEVRVFSRDEKKQEDMRAELQSDLVRFYIGDVRDYTAISDAMRGVDHVFHAAALKQVPSCEFHPMEAVRTNVIGAENVMRAAVANGVERCLVLSTDKAVYPVNAMGMSKAMMEKVMIARSRDSEATGTTLAATRYGNVMASRGSVIPLFLKQIAAGRPVTITDPSMTRFLMSLPESVTLVLYAFAQAQPGDIFVQKSPASNVADLAAALMDLMGRDTGVDIIGTRHGEKRFETLVSREEMARADDIEGFYRVPADNRDLNYQPYLTQGSERTTVAEDYTSDNTHVLDVEGVKALLRSQPYIMQAIEAARAAMV
jgi:UDP-N-acetylglucosamine 4,6-dehydratase/5-epimerase